MSSLEKEKAGAEETAAGAEEETAAGAEEETAAAAEAGKAKVQLVDVLEPMASYMHDEHDEELAKLMQVSRGFNTGLKENLTPVKIKAMKAARLGLLERVEKTKLVCKAQRELDDDEFETKYCHELRETNSKSIIRRHLFLFKKNCDGLPGLLGAPAAIEKFNNLYERRQVELLYKIIKPGMDPPDDRTVSMWVSRRDLLCLPLIDPPSIFTRGAVVKLGVLKNDNKQHSKKMAKISSVTLTGKRDRGNRENGHVEVILDSEGWRGQPVIDVGFDEVESLTLNGNAQLTDLDLDGIEFMKQLKELNLENNQLECLPPIPWVQILNISHNKIKSLKKCHCVNDALFFRRDPDNYSRIVELHVNDNQITSLEGVRFCMSLEVLELRGNPLTCLDKAVFPIGLDTFELDARNVTSLTEFVIPTHLLRSLDSAPEEVLSKYVIMKQNAYQAADRPDGRKTTSMFLLKTSPLAHAAGVLELELVEAFPLSNHTDDEVARQDWDSRTEKLIKLREEGFTVAELKALGAEHGLRYAGYSWDEIHGTSSSFQRRLDDSDSDGGAAGHGNDKEYAQGNTSGCSKSSLSNRGRGNKSKTRRRQRQGRQGRQGRQSKRNKMQRKNKYSRRRRSSKSKSK